MGTKEDIIEILLTIYQVPGQFFICSLIALGIGNSFLSFTNWGYLLIVLGIIFIIIEAVSPILAGARLYNKALENIKKIFKN